MAIQLAMAIFFVCLISIPDKVNSNNEIRIETQKNLQHLFDSLAKNDNRKIIDRNYYALQQNTVMEQQAFNLIKRELQFAQRKKSYLNRYRRDDLGQNTAGSKQNGKNEESTSMGYIKEKPRKELPARNDFRYIIENNMIYVDKTDIIYRMIRTHVYVFLFRPPQFGKSLLVSTLSYLFEGGPSNAELFNGTKIQKTTNYNFPEYTVLNFDFAIVACSTLQAFNNSLRSKVGYFMNEYGIHKQGCINEVDLKDCTNILLKTLYAKKNKRQIVVLIDEYDHPWRNFKGDEKDRQIMLNIMKNFFIVLKSSDKIIRFCFATGSTKIALADFFSGYNCALDISWLPYFETIVGFSQSELKIYFAEYIKDHATRLDMLEDKVYQKLDETFKGYRFSQNNKYMYNSRDIIDFFENDQFGTMDITTYQKRADSKYVVEVIQKIPELTIGLDLLTQLNTNKDVIIPIDVDFIRGFKESFTSPKTILKVLYEEGLLSIKHYNSTEPYASGKYYIGFTNKAAQRHYHKILTTAFKEQIWFSFKSINSEHNPGFREPLEQRDIISFLKRVCTYFSSVPSLLLPKKEKLVESLFQLTLYYGMILSGMQTNWETILATGRLDVRATTPGTSYIFELKRKNNSEWKQAMEQCYAFIHQECFRKRQIVCIGIVFEDKLTESKRVIHAWGMFEKFSNGSFFLVGPSQTRQYVFDFVLDQNSLEMTKYKAEDELA